ncbi:MAG: envelope stress response membrane protein PspC [Candidatus Sumerlaeia bacterium]|nr:envelope stress response membrane protein PspC [Candidatus Sumerlaeia bacterium]
MTHNRSNWERGLYRSRNGMILGVCKGIADYLEFPVTALRAITVILMLITGPGIALWVIAYFVVALLMKPEPILPFESESDREFYDSYAGSPSLAIHRLKQTYDALDRRIQRMESIVTSKDWNWQKRLNE